MTEEPKCRDCKWLTGKKNIRGIECMHPKNQEKWNKAKTLWMGELRKDTARYKQRNAPACKKFEIRGSEETPSKDVVRCQDCKYWVYNFNGCSRNPCTEPWYATDFCSYGERSR